MKFNIFYNKICKEYRNSRRYISRYSFVYIGNQHTSTANLNTANSLEDLIRTTILSNSEKNLVATDTNIISFLKSKDNNFNENNYELTRRTGGSTDIETRKKYVLMSVRSENHKDGSVGYAYDTVKYEL